MPTRIDLCNSWDKDKVERSSIMTKNGPVDLPPVVFFYGIDNKSAKPIEINAVPKPITSVDKVNNKENIMDNTSVVEELKDVKGPWVGRSLICGENAITLQYRNVPL